MFTVSTGINYSAHEFIFNKTTKVEPVKNVVKMLFFICVIIMLWIFGDIILNVKKFDVILFQVICPTCDIIMRERKHTEQKACFKYAELNILLKIHVIMFLIKINEYLQKQSCTHFLLKTSNNSLEEFLLL